MAIRKAIANGAFNASGTWEGGVIPVDGDTAHPNGFSVSITATLNQPNTTLSNAAGTSTLGTSIAAGGDFALTASVNVTLLAVTANSVTAMNIASNVTATLTIATVTGGTLSGIEVTATSAVLTFVSCLFVGSAISTNCSGLRITAASSITFTNCTARGGAAGLSNGGVYVIASCVCTGTLNLSQGASSLGAAIYILSGNPSFTLSGSIVHQTATTLIYFAGGGGTVNYTATSEVIAGTLTSSSNGLYHVTGTGAIVLTRPAGSFQMASTGVGPYYTKKNSANSNITINGDITCGTAGGLIAVDTTAGSGSITINGTVTGPLTTGSATGFDAVASGRIYVKNLTRNATSGQLPSINGPVYLMSDSQIIGATSSGSVTLVPAGSVGDPPARANVRSGTLYHYSTLTGTLIVPLPAYVSTGVPTDNTVGTLVAGMTALELRQALFHADDVANKLRVSEAGKVNAVLDSAVGAQITNIENASGYLLAVLAGACADPQTASETYAITVFGSTFTVDMAGQTSTGTRTAPTLTKA